MGPQFSNKLSGKVFVEPQRMFRLESDVFMTVSNIETGFCVFDEGPSTLRLESVMALFWARVLCRLALQEGRFWTRIILEVVFIRSLVCAICVLARLWSASGLALKKRVHEKVVKT